MIKPWYDNYCFSEESLNRDPKIFNCDMVLYSLRQKIDLGYSCLLYTSRCVSETGHYVYAITIDKMGGSLTNVQIDAWKNDANQNTGIGI